jgi:hypothetical protein
MVIYEPDNSDQQSANPQGRNDCRLHDASPPKTGHSKQVHDDERRSATTGRWSSM